VENEVEPRAIQALLVTPDPFLVTAFTAVCSELSIELRTTTGNEGIIEELQKQSTKASSLTSTSRLILL
jgi:hypothetical protein